MNITRFRVQIVAVAALVILVGWPRFRPAPVVQLWASRGVAPQPELLTRDARLRAAANDAEQTGRSGAANNQRRNGNGRTGADEGNAANESARRTNSDEPTDLRSTGAQLNAIVGRARTLTNQPVPYGRVVLRNTRTGLIEARATADQEGRFSFLDMAQSGYVIELVGADGSVIASSELVSVQNGEMRQATVRVAANSTVRAIFGSTAVAPTVQEAVNRAVQNNTRDVSESVSVASPQ
jgi:hypothetical protein